MTFPKRTLTGLAATSAILLAACTPTHQHTVIHHTTVHHVVVHHVVTHHVVVHHR